MSDQKVSKGGRKIGNQKDRCTRYRNEKRRERNKLKHVLRSSMLAEAKRYAILHGLTGYLNSILATVEIDNPFNRTENFG